MKADTLHLVLKHKWYDMIASGKKTEEYREYKPYWRKRIDCTIPKRNKEPCKSCVHHKVDVVYFTRGYTHTRMVFEVDSITVGRGNPEWGAPTDKEVFIIKLGERLE